MPNDDGDAAERAVEDGSVTRSLQPMARRQTKPAIIDAALGLFEERGFEATTMRAIAERAGVSVGNAYYYFASKDELIQGFYDRAMEEHAAASAERLAGLTDLTERIVAHADSWFAALGRYHQFATQFFRVASDPSSPLSPFSSRSAPAREAAIAGWRDVVEGARTGDGSPAVADRLRSELPELLWLYHLGLILFWVHDGSADQAASRLVLAGTAPVIVRAIGLADVPELAATIDDLARLVATIRPMLAT
ncbi:TetR/AcrR family transcriptional regulator [Desertimonas flava]|jgi:AcrR family transcriptional regulator|uniref:TetR/AcrR family transcriptional regulator n=2 Tax=Desertimonas flava TaxID=2064846 RepID=UPI001968C564|nr:TetR family transcriptional regulator [Desertimonas flava]